MHQKWPFAWQCLTSRVSGFLWVIFCEPRQDVCSCSCGGALPFICGRHDLYIYPPWNEHSTWKMDVWNTRFLLGRPIFRGYVSFRERNYHILQSSSNIMKHHSTPFSWWRKKLLWKRLGIKHLTRNFYQFFRPKYHLLLVLKHDGVFLFPCANFCRHFRSCWWIHCWEDYVTITVPWIDSRYIAPTVKRQVHSPWKNISFCRHQPGFLLGWTLKNFRS